MTTPSLTTQLLEILYHSPEIHHSWKDALSDRILDEHRASHPLTPQALLEYLRTTHPQVFQRLTQHPLVRHDVLALVAQHRPRRTDDAV